MGQTCRVRKGPVGRMGGWDRPGNHSGHGEGCGRAGGKRRAAGRVWGRGGPLAALLRGSDGRLPGVQIASSCGRQETSPTGTCLPRGGLLPGTAARRSLSLLHPLSCSGAGWGGAPPCQEGALRPSLGRCHVASPGRKRGGEAGVGAEHVARSEPASVRKGRPR